MTQQPEEYVAARRTLLDVLDALATHRRSMVLIGAQAVYLHTGTSGLAEPPMTTDADLALDADLLADDPEIAETMVDADFELKQQPGHWESPQGVAVDLMVAPHQANRSSASARAAHLAPHGRNFARIGPGLAPALTDNVIRSITALDPADSRVHEIRVAGPAALLVAKGIKISDRLDDASRGRSARVVDKDALDMFRLLQACSTAELASGLTCHPSGSAAHTDVIRGMQFLSGHGTEPGQKLPLLAERASGGDPTVAASFVVLARELLQAVPQG